MPNCPALLYKYVTAPQKLFIYFILATFLVSLYFYSFDASEPNRFNSWGVGDWLINYAGGFIRRGMGGHLIISLSSFLKIRPELIVFYIKAICYTIIYLGLIYLISQKKLVVLDFLILLSPLTFSFPILDLVGSGRKEIILLAGMTILAIRSSLHFKIPRISTLSLLLLFLTFIHEGLLFFYPLTLLLLPAMFGLKKYNPNEMILLLLPSTILMAFFSFGGASIDQEKLLAIAKEIDSDNFEAWNSGALEALAWTAGDSINQVIKNFTANSFIGFGAALLLFWLMFYLTHFWKSICTELSISSNHLIVIFLIQLPLLIVTLDWGRWLYIDTSLLAIYYLVSRPNQRNGDVPSTLNTRLINPEALDLKGYIRFIVLLAISVTLWKINHCCAQGISWGVLVRPFLKLLPI